MSNFNETAQFAMENKRRLERNSLFYHEYRRAVENVFRALASIACGLRWTASRGADAMHLSLSGCQHTSGMRRWALRTITQATVRCSSHGRM